MSEERELVRRAQRNPEEFGAIFDRYYDPIFAYVVRRVGSVHASQEIVSETFFKALDRLWQFRWRGISISSWLYRIATNEIHQYVRAQKRRPFSLDILMEEQGFEVRDEADLLEEILAQERTLAHAQQWQEVRGVLETLPLKYQEVLTLRYFEDKKIAEIAEITGKKEGTVKSLLSRATTTLRAQCNHKDTPALYTVGRQHGRLPEGKPINNAKPS